MSTTKTWQPDVYFNRNVVVDGDSLSIEVFTNDLRYAAVDGGAEGKVIEPINARFLYFPRGVGGTQPLEAKKTVVGTFTGKPGMTRDEQFKRYGYVRKKMVRWPGIEPRNYTKLIAARRQKIMVPRFTRLMQEVADRWAQAHSR